MLPPSSLSSSSAPPSMPPSPSPSPSPSPLPSPFSNSIDLSLDLSLTLASPSTSSSSSSPSSSPATPPHSHQKDLRLFPCLFCNKKFLKSQALGGHQNAHKKERSVSWTTQHLFLHHPALLAATTTSSLPIASHGCRSAAFVPYSTCGPARFAAAGYDHVPYIPVTAMDSGDGYETMDLLNWQRSSVLNHWDNNVQADDNVPVAEEDEAELDLSLRL